MGGEIQWSALEVVACLLGVLDVEAFVAGLVAMRDAQKAKSDDEREDQHG